MNNSNNNLPDDLASKLWLNKNHIIEPWLHAEVAKRMASRLDAIFLPVNKWASWEIGIPASNNSQGHERILNHYNNSKCFRTSTFTQIEQNTTENISRGGISKFFSKIFDDKVQIGMPNNEGLDLIWSNMLLHHVRDINNILNNWYKALNQNGFIMFSCLGPDSIKEIKKIYKELNSPPPAHDFIDMHDIGDALKHTGFSDPVMDMEIITLTFETPDRLLKEMRELGRNLHPNRYKGVRGKNWLKNLKEKIEQTKINNQIPLTFEIIYGHAIKPANNKNTAQNTVITLDSLKSELKKKTTN